MPKRRREKVEFSVNVDTLAMNAIQTAGALGIFPFAQETTHYLVKGQTEAVSIAESYAGAVDPIYARKRGSDISR